MYMLRISKEKIDIPVAHFSYIGSPMMFTSFFSLRLLVRFVRLRVLLLLFFFSSFFLIATSHRFTRTSSPPIIEDCSGMRFAAYTAVYPQLNQQLMTAGLVDPSMENTHR